MYLSLITTESSAVRMCRICESLQWCSIMSMPSSARSCKYETEVNSTLLSITVASMRLRSTHYCPSQFMSCKYEIEVNSTLLPITVAIMRLRSTHYCPSQFMSYKHEIEVNTLLSITVTSKRPRSTHYYPSQGSYRFWETKFIDFSRAFFSLSPLHFFSRT